MYIYYSIASFALSLWLIAILYIEYAHFPPCRNCYTNACFGFHRPILTDFMPICFVRVCISQGRNTRTQYQLHCSHYEMGYRTFMFLFLLCSSLDMFVEPEGLAKAESSGS